MPKFIYTAKNYEGKTQGGEIIVKDEKTLVEQLRENGFLITSISQSKEKNEVEIKFLDRFSTVPLKEKMMFARNLSVMIASGISITKAINNLSIQSNNKRFKKILIEILKELQSGKTLNECLAKYPSVFGNLFVNMVKVGEAGGTLEEVLKIVAIQMEKEHELRSKIKGAMTYPAVIIVAMTGIGILMLTYILPQIIGVFADMEVTLPASTMFMISMSDFLKNNSLVVIFGTASLLLFTKIFITTELGKKVVSLLLLYTPAVKNLVVKINCARFCRIYSSLLRSGVSVIESLKIISETLTNYYYQKEIRNSISKVQKGVNMSSVLSENAKIFPPLVSQMVEVGEETGKTETVLLKLAEFYEAEIDQITKNLSSIIEPVLMLIIGGAVGFFAVSMMQPMYSVLENIQ